MATITGFVKLLETYRGRDKVMRLLTYLAMFLAGQRTSSFAQKLRIIVKELNGCRIILRLFDDLSMLLHNLKYLSAVKEKNNLLRLLELLSNITNQLYYPIEHIAWLADKNLLSRSSAPWWIACIAFWVISLTFEIIKSLIRLYLSRQAQCKLTQQKVLESRFENTEQNEEISGRLRTLKQEEVGLFLILLPSVFDLLNAVNWLPKGILWSGSFSPTKSGFFGMISSGIMLYKTWPVSEKKHL